MVDKVKNKTLRSESEFHKWFIKNYKSLGYDSIVRKDIHRFPDFIMKRNGRNILVELETLLSNFILHNHDQSKIHEIVCIKKDLSTDLIKIPIKEVPTLSFEPRVTRISATIDPETYIKLKNIMKNGSYRNISHAIEESIKLFAKKELKYDK